MKGRGCTLRIVAGGTAWLLFAATARARPYEGPLEVEAAEREAGEPLSEYQPAERSVAVTPSSGPASGPPAPIVAPPPEPDAPPAPVPEADSPGLAAASEAIRAGGILLAVGAVLGVGAIALGTTDPCSKSAGNNCHVDARNRAALALGLPALAAVIGGAGFLGVGLRRRARARAEATRTVARVAVP